MNENIQDLFQCPSILWLQGKRPPALPPTAPPGPSLWGALLVSPRVHMSFLLVPVASPTCLFHGTFVTVLLSWLVPLSVSPTRWRLPEGTMVCGEEHKFGSRVQTSALLVTAVGLGRVT